MIWFSSLQVCQPNVSHIPSTPFWSITHSGWTIHLLNDPDSTDPDFTRLTSIFHEKVHFWVMRQSLSVTQAQNHVFIFIHSQPYPICATSHEVLLIFSFVMIFISINFSFPVAASPYQDLCLMPDWFALLSSFINLQYVFIKEILLKPFSVIILLYQKLQGTPYYLSHRW